MKDVFDTLRKSLLCWYPFPSQWHVLTVNAHPALVRYLRDTAAVCDAAEYSALPENGAYDCVFVYDAKRTDPVIFDRLNALLKPDGILLVHFRNKYGMRYLCGAKDDVFPETDLFTMEDMDALALDAGFPYAYHWYPLPDRRFVQAVYSEAYLPEHSVHDRVFPFNPAQNETRLSEKDMLRQTVEDHTLPRFTNEYLTEYRKNPVGETVRAAAALLSADRGEEHSFATVFFSGHTVLKKPLYPAGMNALRAMHANHEALRARGISVVPQELREDGVHMPEIRTETLLAYIGRKAEEKDKGALITVFDRMYDNVLKSGDTVNSTADVWKDVQDPGVILDRAYIDMIPYNAFCDGEDIMYYDQEFVREDCPAKYVLFRALRYTYIHLPQLEKLITLEEMKVRYGLDKDWDVYLAEEERFVGDNRNYALYGTIYDMAKEHITEKKKYHTGLLMGVFDLFHIGHLRLIQRAKAQCDHLRVAVLSDELVEEYKHHLPVIPLNERMEILAAVKGVDEVVAVTDNPSRLMEYDRRPFDCFFSGDDYTDNAYWRWEREELKKRGADMVFFGYTQEQSSTKIRQKM